MDPVPKISQQVNSPTVQQKRGCLFFLLNGLKWIGIVLVGLMLLGVVYQSVATELDKRTFLPRGQLYPVNGHQMHMVCLGTGSPAVILQAGGVAESLWWYRVQNQLEKHTRVCAFDRPGLGWSEPTAPPRDALTIAGELHTLLEEAGVRPPYVMAGHSFGAVWTRIYAAQYPAEVAGIVLVDSTFLIPRQFASQSEFDEWKKSNDAFQVPFWVMYRTGLARLTISGTFQKSGYPPDIALELAALQSPNQVFDTNHAEVVAGMLSLTKASSAAENLGDLPMVILWASLSDTNQERFSALREEITTYSSNSVTRMIEGADHTSILGNEQYAQRVSDSILDVMGAAQTSTPLRQ